MKLLAPAKLNLTCDVLCKRPDGYHELDMLNIRLTLCDELDFEIAAQTRVTYENMPAPHNDIVKNAVTAYCARTGLSVGARVHVKKRIPCEAGLGGGSADGAAILLALEEQYGALGPDALMQAALAVGADIPYCLSFTPCRVRGVGERVEPIDTTSNAALWFLLLQPDRGISTAALFFSLRFPLSHPRTDEAVRALERADVAALGPLLHNAMQDAACALLPEIGLLIGRLKHAGALGAAMTGSGSAVFGLFASEAAAQSAARAFTDVPFSCVCRNLV